MAQQAAPLRRLEHSYELNFNEFGDNKDRPLSLFGD